VDLLNFVCDFLGVNHPDVIMQNMGRYFDQMNKQIKGLFSCKKITNEFLRSRSSNNPLTGKSSDFCQFWFNQPTGK